MVRGRVKGVGAALAASALLADACDRDRDMAPEAAPDPAAIHEAMREPAARDALLDTMPGGEMARGDSAAERSLLERKMPPRE